MYIYLYLSNMCVCICTQICIYLTRSLVYLSPKRTAHTPRI